MVRDNIAHQGKEIACFEVKLSALFSRKIILIPILTDPCNHYL